MLFHDITIWYNLTLFLASISSFTGVETSSDHNEIEEDMYFNASFWKGCVDRRVLPPKLLYSRVRAVFVFCGTMIDSVTCMPLFNDRAWKKANNILKEILLGYYSDPPGFSFYSTRLNKKGEPMLNAYGFELLYCNRGTNGVESIQLVKACLLLQLCHLRIT